MRVELHVQHFRHRSALHSRRLQRIPGTPFLYGRGIVYALVLVALMIMPQRHQHLKYQHQCCTTKEPGDKC